MTMPDRQDIARAIFETEPTVIAFVRMRSETTEFDQTPHGIRRWRRAMDVAWATNEKGARSAAFVRATALVDAIRRIEQR